MKEIWTKDKPEFHGEAVTFPEAKIKVGIELIFVSG